jgi:STAND-like protein
MGDTLILSLCLPCVHCELCALHVRAVLNVWCATTFPHKFLDAQGSPSTPFLVHTSLNFMSSTVTPSYNFQLIFDAALADYREHTGVDLSKYPFAEKLQNCQSADAVLELIQNKVKEFKDFRNGNHKLINCLQPVVNILHTFSAGLSGVSNLVSAPSFSIRSFFTQPLPGVVPANKYDIFCSRRYSRRKCLL